MQPSRDLEEPVECSVPDGIFRELLTGIRARLRSICANMPDAEFDALTARMAEIEWKYIHRPDSILTARPKPAISRVDGR